MRLCVPEDVPLITRSAELLFTGRIDAPGRAGVLGLALPVLFGRPVVTPVGRPVVPLGRVFDPA